MAQFNMLNYGRDVVAPAEAIRGSRARNALAQQQIDPNSPRNQLVQEQLTGARQGNVLAQQRGDREQTQFTQEQQEDNTRFAYEAFTVMSENPSAVTYYGPLLKEKGIIPAEMNYSQATPEQTKEFALKQSQIFGKALNVGKSEKTHPGTAMERARNVYGALSRKKQTTPLTSDEDLEYGNAIHALQQERTKLDSRGNLISFKPELPTYGKGAGSRTKIIAEGKKVKADKNKIARIRKLSSEVRSLVEKGSSAPFYERPTGPAGYITSKTQGLRDLGIPVPRAGFETSKRVEEINFLLAPYISGEKGRGISNYDRQRIEKLLGSIDSPLKFDADAVLSAMDIVESYGDSLEDETYNKTEGKEKEKGPESLGEGEEGEFNGKKYRRSGGKLQEWVE